MENIFCRISYKNANNSEETLYFTAINNVDINETSSLSTHPIVSGDYVADHMYKEPITLSIRGSFSLTNKKSVSHDKGEFISIQTFENKIEEIKNNAYICKIGKYTKNESPLFKIRNNMVLTGINFIEKITSVEFQLSFTQIMTIKIESQPFVSNEQYIPSLVEPSTTNFSEVLLDWNYVDEIIISQLRNAGLVTDDFLAYYRQTSSKFSKYVPDSIANIATMLSIVGGGVFSLAIFVINSIKMSELNKKYKEEQFRLYDEDKNKMETECAAFDNMVGNIHKALLSFDKYIKCYKIEHNGEQEITLNIDDYYYYFTFTKKTVGGVYSLTVNSATAVNSADNKLPRTITVETVADNFMNCNQNNRLFKSYPKGKNVYLVRIPESDPRDLRNYLLVVSDIDSEEYEDKLISVIINSLNR